MLESSDKMRVIIKKCHWYQLKNFKLQLLSFETLHASLCQYNLKLRVFQYKNSSAHLKSFPYPNQVLNELNYMIRVI